MSVVLVVSTPSCVFKTKWCDLLILVVTVLALLLQVKTHVVDKFKTYCKLKKITQDKRVIKHMFLVSSLQHSSTHTLLYCGDPSNHGVSMQQAIM